MIAAKKTRSLTKLVVDGWKIEVGRGRKLLSADVQRSMVSAELIHILRTHVLAGVTMGAEDYLEIYEDACKALGISELDPG